MTSALGLTSLGALLFKCFDRLEGDDEVGARALRVQPLSVQLAEIHVVDDRPLSQTQPFGRLPHRQEIALDCSLRHSAKCTTMSRDKSRRKPIPMSNRQQTLWLIFTIAISLLGELWIKIGTGTW